MLVNIRFPISKLTLPRQSAIELVLDPLTIGIQINAALYHFKQGLNGEKY